MKPSPKSLFLLLSLAFMYSAVAAPSLRITKPSVLPNPSDTGPTLDPHAVTGQWFRAIATSNITFRTHEFHDNTPGNGGGWMGHLAISGKVVNINSTMIGTITAFDIDVTIVNDTPGSGTWATGTNSHGETLFTVIQQTGTLHQVILTADFAISSVNNLPAFNHPYLDVPVRILALNQDYEAWYCWNPANPGGLQPGGYFVPAWSIGDIAPGQAVTRRLSFTNQNDAIADGDSRYEPIISSFLTGADILANRSLSLKISHWQEWLNLDDGSPYPEDPLVPSDVSVFHNPDPLQEPPPAETNDCVKWSQPPDCVNGVDIVSWGLFTNEYQWLSSVRIADDWLCDGRPISGLRWWGSYKDWMTDSPAPLPPPLLPIHPVAFAVAWHTDIPASPSNSFSRPGKLIDCAVYPVVYSDQAQNDGIIREEPWCVSELKFIEPGYYEHEYQYTLRFPPTNIWIEKDGSIYWLSVQAIYSAPPTTNLWGWKTTNPDHNWNDDAVRIPEPMLTNEMIYPPPGWETYINHPYAGQSVNMAFELLTDVCPRRAKKWAQPPDMVTGVNMPSFWFAGEEPPQKLYRADDWLCDGRRVTDIHWWGSYLDYLTNHPGPVIAPTNAAIKPLGFSIGWYTDIPTNQTQPFSQPGILLTNFFVALSNCYEVYYGTVLQDWPAGATNYEHEFQYYVDLLDVASPWFETSGVIYWLGIQAVFPPTFNPNGQQPVHTGWGWKTTPPTNRWNDASAVKSSLWQPASYPPGHPFSGPCDLAFELTTDEPGSGTNAWNQPIVIRQFGFQTNILTTGSVGDHGAGVQILQYNTNLLSTNWMNLSTNLLPLPAPYTNIWRDVPGAASPRFYRVIQK